MQATKSSSIAPKILHYHSNGTGRDSYVSMGNGGLGKDRPVTASSKRSNGMNFGMNKSRPGSAFQPKVIYYKADGSGRDNFIVNNYSYFRSKTQEE